MIPSNVVQLPVSRFTSPVRTLKMPTSCPLHDTDCSPNPQYSHQSTSRATTRGHVEMHVHVWANMDGFSRCAMTRFVAACLPLQPSRIGTPHCQLATHKANTRKALSRSEPCTRDQTCSVSKRSSRSVQQAMSRLWIRDLSDCTTAALHTDTVLIQNGTQIATRRLQARFSNASVGSR